MSPKRWGARLAAGAAAAVKAVAGRLAVLLLRLVRRANPERLADFSGSLMRRVGPWLPEHRTGRANLVAAYPDKTRDEVEQILRGVWENIGRVAAEFAHLDRLWDYDPAAPAASRIELPEATVARFQRLRDAGKPALIFAAHLGNWELPALAAATYGLNTAVLYRAPNIGPVAAAVRDIRTGSMGMLVPSGRDAAIRLAAALERGTHVAMLVDQHFSRGVDVAFFGRRCKANPLLARLAQHFDCPIHGTRVIRLPDRRFRVELTEALAPVRSGGDVDVAATMQAITTIVEGWIREYPEQWLWLHRRWR